MYLPKSTWFTRNRWWAVPLAVYLLALLLLLLVAAHG